MAAAHGRNITMRVKSNKQLSMKEHVRKRRPNESERPVRQHNAVPLSRNETCGWCKTTGQVKASAKGGRVLIGKLEILTYSCKNNNRYH